MENICTQKFFKLNVELRWRQSDIVDSVHRRYRWQRGQSYHQWRWMSLSTPGISLTTAANLPPVTLGTGGKFTTCVAAISANGVTAGVSRRYQRHRWSICCSMVFIGDASWVANIFAKIRKISNRGPGKRYDFLTEKYRNQTQMLPQPRVMLFRAVSSASLIRYPYTFQHSPSKLPISLLSCPSLFLATHIPFWHPYLLFDICTSSFLTVSIALLSYTSAFKDTHNCLSQFKM